MLIQTLQKLFNRDLIRLKNEIAAFKNQPSIWLIDHDIFNSAGNLTLHLIGNLNTYIAAEFGKTNYTRDRPLEFSLKNIPQEELIEMIEQTIQVVNDSLNMIREEDLNKEYPILVFEQPCTCEYLLVHLATHLSYHLGQINYHRRLIDH
jgi:uncharacterized damage-inducible protein DinB